MSNYQRTMELTGYATNSAGASQKQFEKTMESLESKLNTLPLTNQEARAFKRFFFSGAAECEVDKQGRVNIPQSLRDYAKLQKDVVIVGLSNRAEIWNNNQWDKYNGQSSDDITKLESQMSKLGI